MPSSSKAEDVEAKYDVTLNYPNLELHSAAASGNVGLVHYALTHGQPVNSVLHGVLPLHAACSGGSLSVVKMLIDRGADVNAPRLPRRYSEGKKTNVPSIGAAGSTPLHFAAANGHAQVVQVLLTCGAISNKMDKNGMTPEALAEINGHSEVLRVLRVWEHLKATDPAVASLAPSVQTSDSVPSSPIDDDARSFSLSSRKGKERAFSFTSIGSDSTAGHGPGRIKSSLESLLRGRVSRPGSFASTRPDMHRPAPLQISESALDDECSPSPFDASPMSSKVDVTLTDASTAEETRMDASSQIASGSPMDSTRLSEDSIASSQRISPVDLGPSPSRHNPSTSGSSRRPSLPSILEKAAHPGAAFRAALKRDHHRPPAIQTSAINSALSEESSHSVPDSSLQTPSHSATSDSSSHHHGFFRGRHRSNESANGKSRHGFKPKHGFASLFKRSHSPPSRSPSPPRRSDSSKPIDPEQMEENMEKMRRASLELEQRDNGSAFVESLSDARRPPASAPATKTSFYTGSIAPPIPSPNPANIPLPATPFDSETEQTDVNGTDRRGKGRQSSGVISPSPLANEWGGPSQSQKPSVVVTRANTEVIRPSSSSTSAELARSSSAVSSQASSSRSAFQPYRSTPPSPLRPPGSRARAVTSPSTPVNTVPMRSASGTKLTGFDWDEVVDLRKVASLRQESRKQLEREGKTLGSTGGKDTVIDLGDEDIEEMEDDTTPDASQLGRNSSGTSVETSKGDRDTGPQGSRASLDVTVPDISQVEIGDQSRAFVKQGRYRGASIGSQSATTESSRISSPPSSSHRHGSGQSDEEARSPTYPYPPYGYADFKRVTPAPSSDGGRARGKSVSSTSSNQTDMSISYFLPSTPATSLTPQSTLSMPQGRFPPVPENEIAHHPGPLRKISNRREARQAKKQAEEDVLQLAQLPPSLDSTRSLAAQLAAYGESLAVEEAFVAKEKRLKGRISGDEDDSSESQSYFSARSDQESRRDSDTDSGVSKAKSKRSGTLRMPSASIPLMAAAPPLSSIAAELLPANAPKSSLNSINNIYDKRAEAYRNRLAALTSLPPTFTSALSSSASSRNDRQRTNTFDSWLAAGPSNRQAGAPVEKEVDRHPDISPPQPVKYMEGTKVKKGALAQLGSSMQASSLKTAPSIAPTSVIGRARSSSRQKAPAPIAEVVQTRYAGMSPPPNVPQPPRLDPNSPYISVFSHRYTGAPHDGDDSDDEEQGPQTLTVIENDWRGGRALGSDDVFEKKRRWGPFRGAIGHLGHRKGS